MVTTPPTADSEAVRTGLANYHSVREERDQMRAQLSHLDRAHAIALAEVESFRQQLAKAQSDLAFYMRYATELQTHVQDAVMVMEKALEKARQGAYRPAGAIEARPAQPALPRDYMHKLETDIATRQE